MEGRKDKKIFEGSIVNFLSLFDTQGDFFIICLIVYVLILVVKHFRFGGLPKGKEKFRKLLVNVIGLLSLIPLIYFIGTDGKKFIFGNDVTDLFFPLTLALIYLALSSIEGVKKFLRRTR